MLSPIVFLFIANVTPLRAVYVSPPECWKNPREYFVGGESAASHLESLGNKVTLRHEKAKFHRPYELSPNKAYAFRINQTSNLDRWSGSTNVRIEVFAEKP